MVGGCSRTGQVMLIGGGWGRVLADKAGEREMDKLVARWRGWKIRWWSWRARDGELVDKTKTTELDKDHLIWIVTVPNEIL